ncbi:hypothetical protein QR77_29160 [Streptomyces sp. 150FB]|nr:hypothetical protein QR77_29160 [Streptomyces sp. 150FB]
MSPVEWWIAGHPRGTVPVLHIVVEGTGPLTADRLTTAVVAASDAVPGTRLTRDGQFWADTAVPPTVRTLTLPDGTEITELAELHAPLADEGGHTCEVLLITGPAATSVVFRASHAVMDAHGVLLWAADVFRALRGEPLVGAGDTATETDVLPPLEAGVTLEPPVMDRPPLLGSGPATGEAAEGARRVFWRRRTVDGYHPGLVAKFATAIADEVGSDQARFAVPVDLRRYAPDVRSTASLSHSLPFAVPAGQPWETTHQQLLTLLSDSADSPARLDPRILDVPMPQLRTMNAGIQSEVTRTGQYPSDASLSHIGRAELADYSGDTFRAATLYSLSMSPVGGPVELDMVESGGHTEITVTWHNGPGLAERAGQLLDRLAESLSPAAHRRWAGNNTAEPLPDGLTVVQLFARQVRATPDAVAVEGPDGDLTYAQLERSSRAVAHALRTRGTGRDEVVGVLADRSTAAITAIWGILRAGAAYLPLDAQHPDARIADHLSDAGAPVCLVEGTQAGRAAAAVPEGCESLLLEELPAAETLDEPWQDADVRPEDLVYVMYTSGSTGRPKGVEIEHRALLNYTRWATRDLGIDAGTRIPLLTSLSFDVSCTSVFLPLLAGGTLLLPSGPPDHATLREVLLKSGATVLSMTPSLLELICELDIEPTGVHTVVTVGEALRRAVAERAQAMFGTDCALLNLYGPTEATVEMTRHRYDPATDRAAGVPIGVPTANCSLYLLDRHGRHVAPGELGELHIGGVQLARGYRGRPDLTRERFGHLADGTRVYRTGDIGRVLPSGVIEYVGRSDEQVKVLGHRVEPAEIAQVLEEHPSVLRAAVIARSRTGQQHRTLCAYVQGNATGAAGAAGAAGVAGTAAADTAPLDTAALHTYLAERLPSYMLPASITVVTGFPQTVSGKIDANRLPDPFAGLVPAAGTAPVRDETGGAVAAVWGDLFGIDPERLGEDADFHQLGGDSLLMLSMIAAVCRQVVGPEAEPRFLERLGDVIREPTIARVAEIAREVRDSGSVVPA